LLKRKDVEERRINEEIAEVDNLITEAKKLGLK